MASLENPQIPGYEILSRIGQGGMGAVYMARDVKLQRMVAIKILPAQFVSNADYLERFQREAVAAAQLNHPGIVQVYSTGESEDFHFIVMELVEGESLLGLLKRSQTLKPADSVRIAIQVAQSLAYAWNKARLIHRDIKPGNIFLSNTGEIKVGDLGLAKMSDEGIAAVTATGVVIGTPHYISPEQARSTKDVDFRSDIYSLGCTLYHILTGRPPYPGTDPLTVVHSHIYDPPPALFKVWPECPVPLGMLVGKMLSKSPHDRHSSYEQLIADLTRVHEQITQPAATAPASAPSPAVVKPVKKKPPPMLIYGGIAAAAAVALVGGLLLWAPWKQSGTSSATSGSAGILPAEEQRENPKETPKSPATPPEKKEQTLVAEVTPGVPAATPSPNAGKMPALPGADSAIQNPESKIQNISASVDAAFLAAVAALDPEDQVSRVMDKLLLLNPKFDGKQTHKVELVARDSVAGLEFGS